MRGRPIESKLDRDLILNMLSPSMKKSKHVQFQPTRLIEPELPRDSFTGKQKRPEIDITEIENVFHPSIDSNAKLKKKKLTSRVRKDLNHNSSQG